jgi:hypothetical protein
MKNILNKNIVKMTICQTRTISVIELFSRPLTITICLFGLTLKPNKNWLFLCALAAWREEFLNILVRKP